MGKKRRHDGDGHSIGKERVACGEKTGMRVVIDTNAEFLHRLNSRDLLLFLPYQNPVVISIKETIQKKSVCYYEKKMILAEVYMKKRCVLLFLALLTAVSVFAKGKYSENDIGKIVLKSGKLVSVENYDRSSFEAIAVVYRVADDGSCFWGLGLNTVYTLWSPKERPVYCYERGYSSDYAKEIYIPILKELKDGSKTLDIIKKNDPEGFTNLKVNYPALYYSSTYGRRYDVGKYKDGWYIPTDFEVANLIYDAWQKLYRPPEYEGWTYWDDEVYAAMKTQEDKINWLVNYLNEIDFFQYKEPFDLYNFVMNIGELGEGGYWNSYGGSNSFMVLVVRKFN